MPISMSIPSFAPDTSFKKIFDLLPQPLLFTKYATGEIIVVNDFFCQAFGFEASQLEGKTTAELGFWDKANRSLMMDQLLKNGVVDGLELEICRRNAAVLHVLLFARVLLVRDEKYLIAVVLDISDRKRAENALRVSEERFRSIFDTNAAATAIFNLDTSIAMVNDAYCRVCGYEREEVLGMSWTEQIPPDDIARLQEYNRARLNNEPNAPSEYEFSFMSKQGERKYGHMSVALMKESASIVSSFVDITEKKKNELLLAQQQRLLEDLVAAQDKALTSNAAQIAHFNDKNARISAKLQKLRQLIRTENVALLELMDDISADLLQTQSSEWGNLDEHFHRSHPGFLSGLLAKHPSLTPAEIKLCSLLHLNMNTKDIAAITNQTYDSVRVARTRLRKKLNLLGDDGLVAYLMQL